MAKPIGKDSVFGDFAPIGRKTTSSGFRYRVKCTKCGTVKTFAESTLRAKPKCVKCKKINTSKSMGSGDLPEILDASLATFKKDSVAIQDLLDSVEDSPNTGFEKEAIKLLIELIPQAEVAYKDRPSQSLAYALNSFLTNVRELIQDLNEKSAQGDLAADIMEKVMRPRFSEIARMIVDNNYAIKKQMMPYVDKARRRRALRELDDATKDLGARIESVYSDIEKGLFGRIK